MIDVNDAAAGPRAGTAMQGHRVLLVTDRPFLEPVDGSTHTYLMWLHVLNDLGCQVSLLSFDRESTRWSAEDLARLPALTVSSLILKAHETRSGAMLDAGIQTTWRSIMGRRYMPAPIEALLRRRQHEKLAGFLRAGQFQSIVLNKLHSTALIGRDLFRRLPARKIIDIHDNYPMRETLNRQILTQMARTNWEVFRSVVKPRDLLDMASWAGSQRLLGEEVRRLMDFDHVVFNAREESEIYISHGLPRDKVAVLPLPRSEDKVVISDAVGATRPYQVGFIASGSLSNLEAMQFLVDRIMPRLWQRGVKLLVAGTVGKFAKPLIPEGGGAVLGWIDDVSTFYDQVEVVLVPLLTGTGVSVKTMEAAAHGAAIVSTRIGMRGLDLEPGKDLLLEDEAEPFTDAVVRLLDDPLSRARLRANSLAGLRRLHSREAFARGVVTLLTGNQGDAQTGLPLQAAEAAP